jgi:hypothetical protein
MSEITPNSSESSDFNESKTIPSIVCQKIESLSPQIYKASYEGSAGDDFLAPVTLKKREKPKTERLELSVFDPDPSQADWYNDMFLI